MKTKNKWILDTNYAGQMALGFSGDSEHIRRSINFAYNYGAIGPSSRIHGDPQSDFLYVITTEEKLNKALELEGEVRKLRDLISVNMEDSEKEILAKEFSIIYRNEKLAEIEKEPFLKYVKSVDNDL